jgi:uncharacterized protein (TIGR03435 family)
MEHLVFEFALRSLLIAVAAAFVLAVLRIRTAAAQHAVFTGVLIVMLALPIWISGGPKAALPVLPARSAPVVIAAAASVTPIVPEMLTPEPAEFSAPPQKPSIWNWSIVLIGIYLIGAAALLLRLFVGTIRANRLSSASCAGPVTVGLLSPKIILPKNWQDWPQGQLDVVLTHERAHARRHDPLVQWLALLNRALFWFHPLAWWLERRLTALAEEACDAAVLDHGHDPGDYSQYLLDLARAVERSGMRLNVTGMAMPGSYLPHRVKKMIAGAVTSRVSPSRMACAAVLCSVCSAVFAAGELDRISQLPLTPILPIAAPAPKPELVLAPAKPAPKPARVLVAQAAPAPTIPAQAAPAAPTFEVGIANAQNAPAQPQFEVASVKRADQCRFNTSIDPGSVALLGVPLKPVLMEAFKVRTDQIEGPSWLETECFDISAKLPEGATRDQLPAMLQALLAERFKLVAHKEDRPRSGYALVVDKGGPKCKEDDPNTNFMGPGHAGQMFIGRAGHGALKGVMTMATLAANLSRQGYGPVEDLTGLTGKYDIELTWTPATALEPAAGDATASAAAPPDTGIPAPQPNLFTALRESLGLKLERRNQQVQFVVIDHIERIPTGN